MSNGESPWGTSLSSAQRITWDLPTPIWESTWMKTRQFLCSSENPLLRRHQAELRGSFRHPWKVVHSFKLLGPNWESLRQVVTPRVLTDIDSGLKKVPLVHFQLRWLQEPWQPSGCSGEDGSERAEHVTAASCWVFGSLSKFSLIYFY